MLVTDVQVRDTDAGQAMSTTLAALPTLGGIAAGFPDYYEFFGTDGSYAAFPLIASGQWDTAMQHLRALRDVSREINGLTGKVVHEITTNGSVYFGTTTQPGNLNETAQFVIAVDLVWRWSGDDAFRDEMYELCARWHGLYYV